MTLVTQPTCCGDCGLLLIIVGEPGHRCHRLQLLRASIGRRVPAVSLEGLDRLPSAIPTFPTQGGVRILLDALGVPMPTGPGVEHEHEPAPPGWGLPQAEALMTLARRFSCDAAIALGQYRHLEHTAAYGPAMIAHRPRRVCADDSTISGWHTRACQWQIGPEAGTVVRVCPHCPQVLLPLR